MLILLQMGMEIHLARGIVNAIRAEAVNAYPQEACGLLLGRGDKVAKIRPCANIAPDPMRHFEIDPAALIAALRAERAGGQAVLGYYHSHPSGSATPSITDAAMAAHDGRIWAICAGEAISWWRDGANGFEVLSTRDDDG
jgi:proteasome lid subunit RPN8/RPN11